MSGSLKAFRPIYDERRPWILMSDPEFSSVADDLIKRAPKGSLERAQVQWRQFPDGTPNLWFDAPAIEGRDVLMLVSVECNLLSVISIMYAVPRSLARTFTVICPFFPTGTMERIESAGEVATAMTLARIMSATPAPQIGQSSFIFMDIHALTTRFYFNDQVKVQLATAVPMFLRELLSVENKEGVRPAIAFPDEGAKKRFKLFFKDLPYDIILCIKTRVGNRRELVIQEGDPKGKHIFIVDDLVQSGGTLITCRDALYLRGATKVSAYVTHGVFPNNSWTRFLPENTPKGSKPFELFMLTDSIPHTARAVAGKAPFKILTVADRILDMLSEPLDFEKDKAHAAANAGSSVPSSAGRSKL